MCPTNSLRTRHSQGLWLLTVPRQFWRTTAPEFPCGPECLATPPRPRFPPDIVTISLSSMNGLLSLTACRAGVHPYGAIDVTFDERHIGAPGLAHGGVIAAACNDVLGLTLWIAGTPAVTRADSYSRCSTS